MSSIRQAELKDLGRISEIEVFNYRLNFYPIFKTDFFFFNELTVENRIRHYSEETEGLYVYDDGIVKGFVHIVGDEVRKLFTEPTFQSCGIGAQLLEFASGEKGCTHMWALEKNKRAISFYERHGFKLTGDRKPESGTSEYLVKLER